jgi:hypothetical protein
LVPSRSGGNYLVWIGDPDERLGLLIVVDNETVDCDLKVDDAREDRALEPTLGEDGEEAFHGV